MNDSKMMAYDELSNKCLEELRDLEEDLDWRVQKVEVLKVQVHLLETLMRKPHTNHAVVRVLENELELIRGSLKDERDALEEVSRVVSPRMAALKEIVESAEHERRILITMHEEAVKN